MPQTDGDHASRAPARVHRRPRGGGGTHSCEEMALTLVMRVVVMVVIVSLAAGHAIEHAAGDAGRRPRKNERAGVGGALTGQRAVNAGGAAQRIRRDPISVPAATPTRPRRCRPLAFPLTQGSRAAAPRASMATCLSALTRPAEGCSNLRWLGSAPRGRAGREGLPSAWRADTSATTLSPGPIATARRA